jgi:Holliday junction resolvase RusA-like endonuclease
MMPPITSQWSRIEFYVPGEPQAQPKDIARFAPNSRYVGQKFRDPKGRKKAWGELVRFKAKRVMIGLNRLENREGCLLGVEIRLSRPRRNKRKYPTQKPDWSNYRYYIENLLQGIVYQDDCQVIGPLAGMKLWATADRPAGAYVVIENLEWRNANDQG